MLRKSFLSSLVVSFAIVSFILLVGVPLREANAVPTFARTYQTSCNTCHTVYPRLTAFGEAFRRNWYQFPEGADAQYLKEEPVSMGAQAYKKVFPKAVWPGAIPHLAAVSFITEGEMVYFPEAEDGAQKLSFDAAAGEVEMFMAGTIGENISFLWELEFEGHDVEVELGTINFTNLFASSLSPNLLNVRIGKFVPEFVANGGRRLTPPKPWIGTKSVGDNAWALLRTQKGIEVNGVAGGRLQYDVGLVEGRKNLANTDKDIYAHVAYKVGGMRMDGVASGDESPLKISKPWQDDSVTVGGFAYIGFADLKISDAVQEDNFTMFGGDVNVFLKNLNLLGGVALQNHDQPTASKESMNAVHIFAEASYVVYPWLVPLVRFETFGLEDEDTDIRILPLINIMLRPNAKIVIVAELEKEGDGDLEAEEIEVALSIGF